MAAFARIYSADKNVAIFLGRPPRMSKKFCHFQTPMSDESDGNTALQPMHGWSPDAELCLRAETKWSALCAFYKEDILELFSSKERSSFHDKIR